MSHRRAIKELCVSTVCSRQIPSLRTFPAMQLLTSCLLSVFSIAGLLVGPASSLPAKRQIISSVHGTLAAPTTNTAIAAGEAFPFEFNTANLCESGYSPLSVWLLQQPPANLTMTSSGEFAEGDYLYKFGDFIVANFGMYRTYFHISRIPDAEPSRSSAYEYASSFHARHARYVDPGAERCAS